MTYYLLPGKSITKPGLPGNKIEAKTTARPISETELNVIKESVDYLVYAKVITTDPPVVAQPEDEAETGTTKSEKRIALEAQATELGIEFTDKTTQKELSALIDAALAK